MASKTTKTGPQLPQDAAEHAGVIAPIRLASLALAAKLDAAKLRSIRLERARLVARFGERSPELEHIDAVFDAHAEHIKTGTLDLQRARVPPLEPSKDHAVIHGRVVDTQGRGIKSVTVTASDTEGKPVASGKSDEAGYYHMKVTPTSAKVSVRSDAKHAEAHELDLSPGLLAIVDMLVKD